MAGLYSWVGNIVFYLIFITVAASLLPNRKYERYLKLFAGMVLILLVMKPLTGSLRLEDRIAYYFESITFQNESEDLKKEILGMEKQRLAQMIASYEDAVAKDVEAMAGDLEFYPVETRVTIDGDQESQQFGMVTSIRMTVSKEKPEEERKEEKAEGGIFIEPVEPVRLVETVEGDAGEGRADAAGTAGEGRADAAGTAGEGRTDSGGKAAAWPDENLNRLRRKVEGYYGLKTADVEIQLAEGER